jgi:hypothetical protein
MNYTKFIETRLKIVNKEGEVVPFILNAIQRKFLEKRTGRDLVLKARQQGFSSLILAMFTADFILKPNTTNVIVADISENAEALLERVKFFLDSYADITGVKVPLKYNSKYELQNKINGSKYSIGTAENTEFGRSRTITNLHMSEGAFYPHLEKILAGALQAVVPTGNVVIETTANGFNDFKKLWESAKNGENGFNAMFFNAADFYSVEFLDQKKRELGRMYEQEYPSSDVEAFLSSGDTFFDTFALKAYLKGCRDALQV